MSDITFRSQQFAQGAQQWSEEMQGGYQQQGFGAVERGIEGLGRGAIQGAEMLMRGRRQRFEQDMAQQEMGMKQQKLEMERQAADVDLKIQEQRLIRAQFEAQHADTLMNLDIKAATAKEANARAELSLLEARRKREELRAQNDPFSLEYQRGMAALTVRTGKTATIDDRGRIREGDAATPEQIKSAREVVTRQDQFVDMGEGFDEGPAPLNEAEQWVVTEMENYPAMSNLRPETRDKFARWVTESTESMMRQFDQSAAAEARRTGRDVPPPPDKGTLVRKIMEAFQNDPNARQRILEELNAR